MNANKRTSLLESYRELGYALELYKPQEHIYDHLKIKSELEQNPKHKWLLIFDNADD